MDEEDFMNLDNIPGLDYEDLIRAMKLAKEDIDADRGKVQRSRNTTKKTRTSKNINGLLGENAP